MPPLLLSVSVMEPAAQALHLLLPVSATNWPATQLAHASVNLLEYFPFAHFAQLVPPVLLSVSVTEPAEQVIHALVEVSEYFPAAHLVQLLPPVLPSESVMEPSAHTLHGCVDCAEYFPAAHFAQLVPSLLLSVSVMEPAAQALHLLLPVSATNWPATQLAHASVDLLEYFPFAHFAQLVPPVLLSVSVTEPAAEQEMQLDSFELPVEPTYLPTPQPIHACEDCVEYFPFAHFAQLVPPVLLSVSVTEPAEQEIQLDSFELPVEPTYLPTPQPIHACEDCVEYFPAAHFAQLLPPVLPSLSVTEPAAHRVHSLAPMALAYLPA
jgi:hypothetical protein